MPRTLRDTKWEKDAQSASHINRISVNRFLLFSEFVFLLILVKVIYLYKKCFS